MGEAEKGNSISEEVSVPQLAEDDGLTWIPGYRSEGKRGKSSENVIFI